MIRSILFILVAAWPFYVTAKPELEGEHNLKQINERLLFAEFKRQYGKNYANEDEHMRFSVFRRNLRKAREYQQLDRGTAQFGITRFSDLTADEFRHKYLNARFDGNTHRDLRSTGSDVLDPAPETFDWRERGAVGPIQDQGECGSCWAFSTLGNVEGQWFKKSGRLLTLSEQQLIDCDSVDAGCAGGYPPTTYGDIIRMGGLELATDYPYRAVDGVCKMDRSKFKAFVNNSIVLPTKEDQQAAWLAQNGPLSAGVNADYLQFYVSGILHPTHRECSPSGLNHAVLLVGFGIDGEVPYWIVRNSWGKMWGENGYFKIYRGDGTCGINSVCSSSIIL